MIHLGDITKIYGYDAPAVDCIIGGSPCQDLSVAGKRAGLTGERSGLFMEQIRIIKEMREQSERTTGIPRPRFSVWENVPGALNSNKGKDFRVVLEEFARIADKNAVIPRPPGKWTTAGAIMGDGWSVAWRVLDAQFWGVPQRRRRIALVADFGGLAAPEILFERKGVCGHFAESGTQRQGTAARVESGAGSTGMYIFKGGNGAKAGLSLSEKTSPCLTDAGSGTNQAPTICIQGNCIDRADTAGCNGKGWRYDTCYTLNTIDRPAVAYSFDSLASNSMKSKNPHSGCRKVSVSKTLDTTTPDPSKNQGGIAIMQRAVYDARGNGNGKTVCTITGDHQNRITDYTAPVMAHGQANAEICEDLSPTLNCDHEQPIFVPAVAHALKAKANCQFREDSETYIAGQMVRRLTPLECERLQGYPDGWTDIGDWTDSQGKSRKTSDSARYKALGNSIALPPWKWVLKRLCSCYERNATMASLFDGIGGFPLIWEQLNGKGTCLWASEIEEFPIAVTKLRFGG